MKVIAITAALTGIGMILIEEPIAAGISFLICVVFGLAALGDDNTWHRH